MSLNTDPLVEVRVLAGSLFDGTLSLKEMERLEVLIVNDPACLQTYVEMVNLHSDLVGEAERQSDEQTVLRTLREFTRTCERRQTRKDRRNIALTVAGAASLCGVLGWFLIGANFKPASMGNVAHLTSNVSLKSNDLQLGQILRQGSTISVAEGIVSVELSNVMIDLIGPAEVTLIGRKQVQLSQGALSAHVFPGGEGFTVRTPDAEVVDQGTEFLVDYDPKRGTEVAVRQGRAQASLLNAQGTPAMTLELTTNRSARFNLPQALMEETIFEPTQFERIDQTRGQIRSVIGPLRTASEIPQSLQSQQTTTPSQILIIPERQNITLDKELSVATVTGTVVIPAGQVVSSYLLHYDPTSKATFVPRGSVTFFGKVAAAIVSSKALNETDGMFGLAETTYDTHDGFRGLESDVDQVQISGDQRTVSVFFGVAPPQYLDQVRVLVLAE
ncbi:MAG TPA: FecR domain-containing protein [Planctomicrobium sp.]|nr:FecR domain-containing protein [Planctomicrobium sp.]